MSDDLAEKSAPCGTVAGASQHLRRNEWPCDPCAAAKAAYNAQFRDTTDQRKRDRLAARGQRQALRRLKNRHLDEYWELYAEECRKAFREVGLDHKPRSRSARRQAER